MAETKKKEIDLAKKVVVKSLANWETSFERKVDGRGSVRIMPNGSNRLSREEIIAQIQNMNPLFVGVDGNGSHATYYIDDAETRIEAGLETETAPQNVLTKEKVKEIFKLPMTQFESALKETVLTRAEKHSVMEYIKELNLNDYAKIRCVERYTKKRIITD